MRNYFKLFLALIIVLGYQTIMQSQTWNYEKSFDTIAPPEYFNRVHNVVPRSFMLDSLSYPFPTNVWFKNLFLGIKDSLTYFVPDSTVGTSPFFSYPYTIGFGTIPRTGGWTQYSKANRRLGFGYRPYTITQSSPNPPVVPGVFSVTYSPAWDLYFGNISYTGCIDQDSIKAFISSYDDLSVTIKYSKWVSGSGYTGDYMEAPIAKGMPYVTMKYNNMTPYLASQARSLAAISVGGDPFVNVGNPTEVEGKRFILRLNGDGGPGNFIYWVLYTSEPVKFKAYNAYLNVNTSSPLQAALLCDSTFTGTLRAAYLCAIDEPGPPFDPYNDSVNVMQKLDVLDKYSNFYPVSGAFSASIDNNADSAVMKFIWETNLPSNDSLLMFALPHHLDILDASTPKDSVLDQYKTIKGNLTGVFGKVWTMYEPLVNYTWYSPDHNLNSNVLTKYRDILYKVLRGDHDTISGAYGVFPVHVSVINQINSSTYFGGKELAKKGRLAVIADELGQWYPTAEMARNIRDTLKKELNRWLNGSSPIIIPNTSFTPNPLLYENHWGGMINTIDYNSLGAGFHNSIYTDHHFHYGYFLYAAAAIGKTDTVWIQEYRNKIMLLARDLANPGNDDPYFVKNRFMDWYDGHSWAQGLTNAGGGGNNQESTSEATNAWYGLYLLGDALGDENIKNTGRLQLASEIRSAKKYWQIEEPDSPYPNSYTDYYKVVGNMYESSINSLVAFGEPGDPRMVYGIQQLPTTPINQTLLSESWCDTIWDFYYKTSSMYTSPDTVTVPHKDQQWMGINLASVGIAKPGHAYAYYHQHLRNYVYYSSGSTRKADNYDDGESKSNVLYNTIVNAQIIPEDKYFVLELEVSILNHDTLGDCSGRIKIDVVSSSFADPPYHYFLLSDTTAEEIYSSTDIFENLCYGDHIITVIDGEFNFGSAEVNIQNTSGIDESNQLTKMYVYPNPTQTGKFHINWSGLSWQPTELSIVTISGVLINKISVSTEVDSSIELNLENSNPGVYYIILKDDSNRSLHSKLKKL